MVVMNDLNRFHLFADVVDRLLGLGSLGRLRQTCLQVYGHLYYVEAQLSLLEFAQYFRGIVAV